jgi:hypothetical protein
MTQQNKDLEERIGTVSGEKKYRAMSKETKGKKAASGASSSYEVQVYNKTSSTIPQISVAYRANDSNQVLQSDQQNVGANQNADFKLTECNKLYGYVIGFFDASGRLLGKFPEQGVMNAQRASQENPNDTDPCLDVIDVGNA